MLKIESTFFADGMAELKLFFPRFKPTADQVLAWYERLKHFSHDEYELAIYRMTEQDIGPSYEMLKRELFAARRDLQPQSDHVPKAQGWAPLTDELKAYSKESMHMLFETLKLRAEKKITREQAQERFDDLKQLWLAGYKTLPEYRTEAQIQELINHRDWNTLVTIGFMTESPKPKKEVFKRSFTQKKNYAKQEYEF